MHINKLLSTMSKSGLETDSAMLGFNNGWGIQIKPDPRNIGVRWNVVVLQGDQPHYNNPIALGTDLIGQTVEDVEDIYIRVKSLGAVEDVEEGINQEYYD